MAEIKLVIRIDEEDFNKMKHNVAIGKPICSLSEPEMVSKVANGIPLPKGHGKLGDLGALSDYFWDNRSKLYTHKDLQIILDNAEAIIPADTESEE